MKNTAFTLTKRALRAALLVLLLGAAGTVNAQTFTVGNLNYSVNEGTQTVTVTGHVDGTSASGSLTIPESVDYGDTNYAVTAIGDEAFKGCSGFTGSLIIPNSVTTIGRYAFYNCGGFNGTLTLGDAVTTIGNYAFTYCSNFTGNLIIPDALTTIGSYAFLYCSNLTGSLVIPNSVTTIGEGAFVNCSGFTGDLVIPDAVITIGRQTFDQCTGFTGNLIIGNHVETIGIYAFDVCTGFTGSLVIPNSVTTIGIMAFRNCFNFDGSLILGDAVETILDKAFEGCTGFSSIESLAVMPPTLGADVFNGWNASTPVYVPCGSGPDYSGWGGFSNIIDLCTIYVKDVMLLGGSESEVNALLPDRLAEGWHLINNDLNAGCGSGTDYIYLLYKSEATEGVNLNYVTGFYISNAGGTAPNSLTYDDRTYYLVPYDGGNHFKSKKGDLNSNASGDDIHLYYTKDVFSDNRVVTEITFNATQSGALGVNGGTTGYDLNSGASGDYIYMHVTKEVALVDPEFAITTSATPSGGGTLSGAGTYHYGDSCTLTATPAAGYIFLSWTKNGTQVSTNPNYTFTVTGNRTFVAQFQEQNYTINVSASPTDGGTVSGAGIYGINTTCTLTATANAGYAFVNWTQGTAAVTTEATFSFTVTQDSTFVANFEQVPDLTTQPDTLDLGYRPAGAWMRPYQFTLTSNNTQTTISMIDFTSSNGLLSFDLGELELPFVLDQNESATIGLAWGDQPGSMDGSLVVIYSSAEATRSAEVFPVEAEIYVPALGDVWETAKEVNAFPYTDTVNADTLYSNYVLPYPNIPTGSDVVYRLEFDHDILLNADLVGSNGKLALYAEGFEDFGGPDLDNYLSVSPEPKDFWFNYNYTSNNTFFGLQTGGEFWFGYKIPAELLAGFGQCYITAVEAAARESYPYNLYVFKGGETPNEATMVYSQEMTENPEAMQFFIMDINTPFAIGETEDVWVIFYSDSPYAAYSGKEPEDPTNAKIWYSENGTTWISSEFYTPKIHVHLQYPKPVGRGEVVLNLADMSMSPAQSMANDRGASTYLIEGLHVPAGTYYLVASSTSDTFSVSIDTMRFPYPPTHLSSLEKGVLYDGEDLHLIWDEPEGNTPVTLYRVYKWDEWNHDFFFHGNADTNEYDQAGLVYGDDGSDYTSYYYKVSAWYAADSLESALTDAYEVRVYPSSTVSGHVLEQDSVTGIADATVNFMAGERVFSGTTDANGAYSVTLPATSYDYGKVWATAAVHDSICYDSTLTVPTGLLEDVDFILRGTSPKDLYISRTGFAMWDNGVEGQRQYLKSLVTLTDMEGDTLFTDETNKSYRQLPTDSLTDGAFYRCLVAHVYTTGPSNTTSQTWFYQSCDHFDGAIDPEGVVDSIGVHLSWGYPEADTTGNMNPANWYYYDDGNYISTASGILVQAVMFPAGTYQGNVLTKIACFDANALNGLGATVTVYNDGENAPDNPVGNLTFTHTGTHQFVEFEFPEPIVIDTTKNLWVLVDVDGYKVACALNHAGGPNNGNWGIGANGVWGHPLYAPTWMIRAQMVSPTSVEDPLGVNIYRDGEWIGFTADSTFLDASGTYNNEYALRVVYDGDSICPNANAYYAMSCPQVVPLASQQLQITVAANPSAGGTVSGAGYYDSGTTVTLTATANEDYVFTSWTKNGQQVSDSPSYSFTVTTSGNYVANFSSKSYAIMATADPSVGGEISGAAPPPTAPPPR